MKEQTYIFKSSFDEERLRAIRDEWNEEVGEHRLIFKKGHEPVVEREKANNATISFGGIPILTHYQREYGVLHLPSNPQHKRTILKSLKKHNMVERPNYRFGIGLYFVYFFAMLYQAVQLYLGGGDNAPILASLMMVGPIGLALGLFLLYRAIRGERKTILRWISIVIMVAAVMTATNPLVVPIVILLLLPLMTDIHRTELYNLIERYHDSDTGSAK